MKPYKPQPYYARLTQPPRSPSNGRNRRTAPANHSDPLDRADPSSGGTNSPAIRTPKSKTRAIWRSINSSFAASPGLANIPLDAIIAAGDIQKMIDDMRKTMYTVLLYGDSSKPPTLPHIGIRSGEIIGHRGWMVVAAPSGPMLRSLAHHFLWVPGETIIGDINEQVSYNVFNPIFGGIYAFREAAGLDSEIEEAKNATNWPMRFLGNITYLGFAYGTVKLWGETVEHEDGYRASFAKLTSIDGFIGIEGFNLDALRSRYHV